MMKWNKHSVFFFAFFLSLQISYAANLYDNLLAPQKDIRLASLKNILKTTPLPEDRDVIESLTFLLNYENDPKVLSLILDYFDKRNSREDFFYLIDFLPLARDTDLITKSLEILHRLHAPTLRRELKNLNAKNNRPDLSLVYLKILKDQNKNCPNHAKFREWIKEIYKEKNFQKFMVALDIQKFMDFFEIYQICSANQADGFILKYYLALKEDNFFNTEKNMTEFLNEWQKKIPETNRTKLLQIAIRYNPSLFIESVRLNEKIQDQSTRFVLYQYAFFSASVNTAQKEWIAKLISQEKNKRNLYYIAAVFVENSTEYNLILKKLCQKKREQNKKICNTCYSVFLQTDPAYAENYLFQLEKNESDELLKLYLRDMLLKDEFHSKKFYRRVLNSKNPDFTASLFYHIPLEEIKKYQKMFFAYAAVHPSARTRGIAHSRFLEDRELYSFWINQRLKNTREADCSMVKNCSP